jgi:pyridoxamine 5'-phosphate oxidase
MRLILPCHGYRVCVDPELARMRADYAAAGLDEAGAGNDPFALFDRWVSEAVAAEVVEPNAMALATSTVDGRPSVRIVLLKGLDEDGAVFFTNYDSRKGEELEANPHTSAVMLWHSLQRQVRIEGTASRITRSESDDYFAKRPRGAQLGAVTSRQSRAVSSRSEIEARFDSVEAHFAGRSVERPEHWGGYRIDIHTIEFWQGRPNRLHDRLLFSHTPLGWSVERLSP